MIGPSSSHTGAGRIGKLCRLSLMTWTQQKLIQLFNSFATYRETWHWTWLL